MARTFSIDRALKFTWHTGIQTYRGGKKGIIFLNFLECSCKISRYFAIKGWKDWPFGELRAGSGASQGRL